MFTIPSNLLTTFLLWFFAEKSLEVLQEEIKLSKKAFAEGTSWNLKVSFSPGCTWLETPRVAINGGNSKR